MDYYLLSAYREKLKTKGKTYDVYNDSSFFASVYREISGEILSWQHEATGLLDTQNWRLNRLIQKDGSLRKPKAYLCVERTAKDNLVLDWYPSIPVIKIVETDWCYWDNSWTGYGSLPFNRILMIRGFGYYLYENSFDKAEIYLIKAVKKLFGNIYSFLNRLIDIKIVEDFYLTYQGYGLDEKLVDCRIRSVEEVEVEEQKKKREEWLKENFHKKGLSPEEFLQLFKRAGLKYKTTSKLLANIVKVSPYQIKSLVNRLFDEYPEIYDKILKIPPHGKKPRESRVVKVDFKKKT